VRFEYSTDPQFATSAMTEWQTVRPEDDFTAKARLADLKPETKYYYRVRMVDATGEHDRVGPVRQFQTAPPADALAAVQFASITGQCFEHRDSDEGFFSYRQMLKAGVDFIVPTGDNGSGGTACIRCRSWWTFTGRCRDIGRRTITTTARTTRTRIAAPIS
jgi:phosphodiesterase/alkaline phosphatase D-like protein